MSSIFSSKNTVISSDGGLRWCGRYAKERTENGEQLMRVRHGFINFGLILISLALAQMFHIVNVSHCEIANLCAFYNVLCKHNYVEEF